MGVTPGSLAVVALLHGAGFAVIWWFVDRSTASLVVMLAFIALAVALMLTVVLPRYRRYRDTGDRTPVIIVHVAGGDTDRTLRQPKSEEARQDVLRNSPVDIHGTG